MARRASTFPVDYNISGPLRFRSAGRASSKRSQGTLQKCFLDNLETMLTASEPSFLQGQYRSAPSTGPVSSSYSADPTVPPAPQGSNVGRPTKTTVAELGVSDVGGC